MLLDGGNETDEADRRQVTDCLVLFWPGDDLLRPPVHGQVAPVPLEDEVCEQLVRPLVVLHLGLLRLSRGKRHFLPETLEKLLLSLLRKSTQRVLRLRLLDGLLRLFLLILHCLRTALLDAFYLYRHGTIDFACVLITRIVGGICQIALIFLTNGDEAGLGLQVVIIDDRLARELPIVRIVEPLQFEELLPIMVFLAQRLVLHQSSLWRGAEALAAVLPVLGVLDQHLVALLLDLIKELLRVTPDLCR